MAAGTFLAAGGVVSEEGECAEGPVRSGVPIPARDSASQSAGGKFAGIRRMVAGTPCSESICQKALPVRRVRTPPAESGIT